MSSIRNFRPYVRILRIAAGLVLGAVAILPGACQVATSPPVTPLPVPASEEAEAAAPTKPASEESSEESEEQRFFSAGLIQLRDPLDEPEFYCVDVPGVGRTLNLQGALTAHTCKPGAEDEIFHVESSSPGQISMPAYNLCMEAEGPEAGNSLHLAECSSAPLQQFRYFDIGQIRLAHSSVGELCLTVASGVGEPTGGPSHLRRGLTIEACDQVDTARSLWIVGSPVVVTVESSTQE